jgi:hypothetical protein
MKHLPFEHFSESVYQKCPLDNCTQHKIWLINQWYDMTISKEQVLDDDEYSILAPREAGGAPPAEQPGSEHLACNELPIPSDRDHQPSIEEGSRVIISSASLL